MPYGIENPKLRRGQVRPISANDVTPTGPLSARETEIFNIAERTRPGFWAAADMLLLTTYARSVARLEALETADPPATGAQLAGAVRQVVTLARVLRLSPQARDRGGAAVAPPGPAGQEVAPAAWDDPAKWRQRVA